VNKVFAYNSTVCPSSGGRFGGHGFYLKNGKPAWLWTMVDLEPQLSATDTKSL